MKTRPREIDGRPGEVTLTGIGTATVGVFLRRETDVCALGVGELPPSARAGLMAFLAALGPMRAKLMPEEK